MNSQLIDNTHHLRVFSVLSFHCRHTYKTRADQGKRMEEKQLSGAHRILIIGRKNGTVSGVSDVQSFDENEIVMDTDMGMLTIRGKGLHISKLNLEKGEAELEGQVDSLVYSAKGHRRKKEGSLLRRLLD